MNALVFYDSHYGNTECIARIIANTLRASEEVRAVHVDAAHPAELKSVDLLVVVCPKQGWRPTPAIQSFLEKGLYSRTRLHSSNAMTISDDLLSARQRRLAFRLRTPVHQSAQWK